METVSLTVTSKSLCHIGEMAAQKQIAIETSSSFLREKLAAAKSNKKLSIRIANSINLKIGDAGAIRRSHNIEHEKEFDALFQFLRNFPDQAIEFICLIEQVPSVTARSLRNSVPSSEPNLAYHERSRGSSL